MIHQQEKYKRRLEDHLETHQQILNISRKINPQEKEIDFRGRVAGWRKRRASTIGSDRGGGDAGTVGDNTKRDAVQRRDAALTQADAEGRRATQSHAKPCRVMKR